MTKKTYKALLFDLDGTLIDSEDLILSSAMHAIKELFDIEGSRAEFAQFVGIPLSTHLLAVALEHFDKRSPYKGLLAEEPTELRDQLFDSYTTFCNAARPDLLRAYEGIDRLVSKLNESKVPRGIITSKRRVPALTDLAVFGLDKLMPVLVAADDLDQHKPDPAPLLYGMTLTEDYYATTLIPEECIYIGDSPFDLQAANAAGMDSVAVTYGLFERNILVKENPRYIVENTEDLFDLVFNELL